VQPLVGCWLAYIRVTSWWCTMVTNPRRVKINDKRWTRPRRWYRPCARAGLPSGRSVRTKS